MKHIFLITLLSVASITCLSAQSTIVDALHENVPFQGTVQVNASPEINQLLGKKNDALLLGTATTVRTSGYRVQVFSGNEQRVSKAEALKKADLVNENFPDVPTYVTLKAPYWRLRVGDFRSYEEAFVLLKQISQEIPSLKKEMYVVKDEVILPIN